jgi:hypothetical protein
MCLFCVHSQPVDHPAALLKDNKKARPENRFSGQASESIFDAFIKAIRFILGHCEHKVLPSI